MYTDKNKALNDFNGIKNTKAIVKLLGSSDDIAAGYCNNYRFINGQRGYLGSIGEWYSVYQNLAEVNEALIKIGSHKINAHSEYTWSSTMYDERYTYCMYWSKGYENAKSVEADTEELYTLGVRAFGKL